MTKEQSQILLYIVVFIVIAFNMLKMKKNYEVLKKQKEEEERIAREKEEEERKKNSTANKVWGWMKRFGHTIIEGDNENMA